MTAFHCPRWPGCGCPDGTHAVDCPGLAALRATPRRDKLAVSAERLVAEMGAAIARGDALVAEAVSIVAEIARIREDMARLHGVPIALIGADPAD